MHLTHYYWCKSPPCAANVDTKWFWIEHRNNNNNNNNNNTKQQYQDCSKLQEGSSGQGDVLGACGLASPSEANSFTHHAVDAWPLSCCSEAHQPFPDVQLRRLLGSSDQGSCPAITLRAQRGAPKTTTFRIRTNDVFETTHPLNCWPLIKPLHGLITYYIHTNTSLIIRGMFLKHPYSRLEYNLFCTLYIIY